MDPKRGKLRSPSPETQTPLQSSLEPWAPDNRLSSFQYGHTSSMPIYIQQALTSSPATVSHPTPSTTLSLLSSTPDHMQHYTIPASAMDAHDPVLGPSSPLLTQDDTPKKIPRPPNAFMLFRSWLIHDGKLPPEIGRRQQDISRIAGKAWNLLDESSKDGWRKEAIRRLHDHERKHPGYKFEPSAKSRRTGLEKIRKAADDYAKDHRAVNPTPARRPRQRASSYKFPAKEHTPQQLVRGPQIPQLITGSQLGSPSMASLITFDSPSPSSVGPLPLHTRSHAFLQGMPRQPSPYSFLPPGHPGHFERAHRHENGIVVFADNYTPVNQYAPPPEYHTFDHTGIVPAVDTCGIMTNAIPNTTAAMLGPYELDSPRAHFDPSFDASGNGLLVFQSPVQTSRVPPITNALSTPLSTAPLTPHEQQVLNTII